MPRWCPSLPAAYCTPACAERRRREKTWRVSLKDSGARGNDQPLRQYVVAVGPPYRDDGWLHDIP